MVPSVSLLTEFHCLTKSNICQTVIQTCCESRTVSWKLTTKTDCDEQELRCCQYSIDYIFCTLTLIPELMVEENCLSQQQCKLLLDTAARRHVIIFRLVLPIGSLRIDDFRTTTPLDCVRGLLSMLIWALAGVAPKSTLLLTAIRWRPRKSRT